MTAAIASATIAEVAKSTEEKPTYWPLPDDLRKRIKRECSDQGVKQTELAELVGVTDSAISQMLNSRLGSSQWLPQICRRLGIDYTEYLTPDPRQRRILQALFQMQDVPELATRFVEEVETLSRRMLAEHAAHVSSDEIAPSRHAHEGGKSR